jgi:cytochrome c
MNTMLLTKISGAVLLTALVAMIVSFAGDILVPPGGRGAGHGTGHIAGAGHGGGTGEAAEPAKEPPVAKLLASGDLEAGKRLAKRCHQCHTLEKGGPNKLGPNLYGVVGRERGTHAGFNYSAGMKAAGGKWTYENIYHFLRNPIAAVKGTKMTFKMPKPEDRANVLLYLRTLADNPVPLPPPPKEAEKKPEAKAPEKKPEEKKPEAKAAEKPPKKAAEKPAEKAPEQMAAIGALLATADAKRGETLAKRKCRACHSFAKGAGHKVGPNLYGVVLRDRGTVEGYRFSSAMKAKGGKWTYADLFTFLANPKAFVKGTKMTLKTAKDKDRADLIAYLRTLSDSPPPLPAK